MLIHAHIIHLVGRLGCFRWTSLRNAEGEFSIVMGLGWRAWGAMLAGSPRRPSGLKSSAARLDLSLDASWRPVFGPLSRVSWILFERLRLFGAS